MKLDLISNNKLTLLRKLKRKKYRQKESLFTIEGIRAVQQIIDNNRVVIEALFFDEVQQLWTGQEWQPYTNNIRAFKVDRSDFMDITDTDTPQGVLALCQMPGESTISALSFKEGLLIATDGIQDPGNLGTIIRTACWFDVEGILAGNGTVDLFHPKVTRSTAGATGVMPYLNADLKKDLSLLEKEGWKIVLLDAGPGATDLKKLEKSDKTVLVVGNEANGINNGLVTQKRIKACITSPVNDPSVESLNASIALSIALYTLSG